LESLPQATTKSASIRLRYKDSRFIIVAPWLRGKGKEKDGIAAIVGEARDRRSEATAVGIDEVSLTGDSFDGEPVAVEGERELAGGCVAADMFNVEVSCAKSPVIRQPPIYVVYA
jgi:hypothetical protein